MAEEQKNVEVPPETKPETVPATKTPAVESKPPEETPAESAPATEDKPAETEESKAEGKKEEVKPIEEGHLGHKAQGLSFPKNLIASKEFFFFGTDAFEPKALAHYLKTEKSAETAHSNIAWASHTGQGLLFVGDKKNPSSIISLADATEPETDGSHKFHFTSKGNKHSFNAANTAERDNWVAQLKLKIAEDKELAATVTESEAYKKTIESFKPAPPKKEKAAEAPKEEKTEGSKEEEKTEGSKRRSVSLPFAFGKREKSPAPAEGEEKSGKSPFSKLHAAIKGKAKAKEKPSEETKPEELVEAAKEEDKTEEPKTEAPKEEEPAKQAEPEAENKPDNVASSTPAATAAA